MQQILLRTDLAKWVQVHINAAHWLENNGFEEEAVEHFLEGKQHAHAVRLIEKNLLGLVQSKSIVLNRWLSVLPEADQLHVTGETVKSHIKNLYKKLDVNNRIQALHRAKN